MTEEDDSNKISRLVSAVDAEIQRLKAKRQKLLVGPHTVAERRLHARQNSIIGSWLRETSPRDFERIVRTLTRTRDIEAFSGLYEKLNKLPASAPRQDEGPVNPSAVG